MNNNKPSVKHNPYAVQVPPVSNLVVILIKSMSATIYFLMREEEEAYPSSLHSLALLRQIRIMQILLGLELLNENIIQRVHVMKRERKDQERQNTADTVQDGRCCQQPRALGVSVGHDGR